MKCQANQSKIFGITEACFLKNPTAVKDLDVRHLGKLLWSFDKAKLYESQVFGLVEKAILNNPHLVQEVEPTSIAKFVLAFVNAGMGNSKVLNLFEAYLRENPSILDLMIETEKITGLFDNSNSFFEFLKSAKGKPAS